ncbi:PREDICTED: uncharacterized protein LOC109462143 [Branchiostoma belcheri]|uniref:Uncharacterized protein LOC109462143 n=1 Tax=Branchiostoma belcheri TaxID=7741 RepID=A0A6P4YBK7_BRABE|nr:PREDICTED: uncharacterized protein LOC109462143 [Branchiostoma belcheri]
MSQSIREENNPVYDTNHPEEPTSLGKNEQDNLPSDQNVLYIESTTAEPTRKSTCGQNSPSSQGQDSCRLEATYVAGNEVEHATTNEHYYMSDNNDIPTPGVADVYSVSDPIHAENSAMYTASGENDEDGNSTGNIEKEQQNTENAKQADSTVTMNFNSNRKANKSQPDTTQK